MSSDATDTFTSTLLSSAPLLGLSITPRQLDAYSHHYQLLVTHNPRAGLTAITDPTEAAIKHFLDSLTALLIRDIAPAERVADIGSGGGFPGLVLAVARPHAHFTLLESVRKRARFLELAVQELGLPNVAVLHTRAEAAGKDPAYRETYHLVVSRAVAPLPRLLKYSLPLLRPAGHLIAYQGPVVGHAASVPPGRVGQAFTLPTKRARVIEVLSLALPHNLGARTLLLIQKAPPLALRSSPYASEEG